MNYLRVCSNLRIVSAHYYARHLGLFFALVRPSSFAATVFLVEMAQRTLKNLLRLTLRAHIRAQASEFAIKNAVVKLLNDCSGGNRTVCLDGF